MNIYDQILNHRRIKISHKICNFIYSFPKGKIYKRMEKIYMDDFFQNGNLYINTLRKVRDIENQKLRDLHEGILKSGYGTIKAKTANEIPKIYRNTLVSVPDDWRGGLHLAVNVNFVAPDVYIFCTTYESDEYKAVENIGYDSSMEIINPYKFFSIIFDLMEEKVGVENFRSRDCKYTEKIVTDETAHLKDIYFDKDEIFYKEKEYRGIWVPKSKPMKLEPVSLEFPISEINKCVVRI